MAKSDTMAHYWGCADIRIIYLPFEDAQLKPRAILFLAN